MIEILIDDEMRLNAQNKVNKVQFDLKKEQNKFGSDRSRTVIGYLGEQLVLSYLGEAVDEDNFEYDLMYKNLKIEVKTIACKFKPKEDYLCTVNSPNDAIRKQAADYYIFTRILNDHSKGWILGYMKCAEFFEKGKFVKKGSEALSGLYFSKSNATTLPISKLHLMRNDK